VDPRDVMVMVASKRTLQVFLVTWFVWYLASIAFGTSVLLLLFRDLRFFRLPD